MDIQSEIKDYIHAHDFVMLPGIGAFLAEYSKPYFDAEGNIVPSERNIRFNPHLRNDSDVSVLEVFRNKLNVSSEDVQNRYFDFLEHLHKTIENNGQFNWSGLGVFFKSTQDGSLHFVSSDSSLASKIDILDHDKNEEVTIPTEVTPKSEIKFDTIQEITEDEVPYVYKKRKKESGILNFLIFALPLALLAGSLIYMVFFKPKPKKTVNYSSNSDVRQENAFDQPLEIDTLLHDTTIEDSRNLVIAKEHIVGVGIYKNNKDADKIATFLAEEGYPSRVRPYGTLFKVYLVASSENQALQYVKEVEQLIGDKPVYER
jgi:hypothetical protein